MILEPIALSAQTVHLSSVKINTITKLTEMSFHLTDVNLDYRWEPPKGFPRLCYILAQTVHLSCAEMNTISKQTQNSFHLAT
jgi:hypothetical protein